MAIIDAEIAAVRFWLRGLAPAVYDAL